VQLRVDGVFKVTEVFELTIYNGSVIDSKIVVNLFRINFYYCFFLANFVSYYETFKLEFYKNIHFKINPIY